MTKNKIMAILMTFSLSICMFQGVYASDTSNEDKLEALANRLIKKEIIIDEKENILLSSNIRLENALSDDISDALDNPYSETIKYSNIQNFVMESKKLNIEDEKIVNQLAETIEMFSIDGDYNLQEDKAKDMIESISVTSTISYFKVTEDGKKEQVTEEEVLIATYSVGDDKDWMEPDGWMGIRTSAFETKRVNGRAFINVIAEQCWFKAPKNDLKDMIAINSGATYVNTFDTWGQYFARAQCKRGCHKFTDMVRDVFIDKNNPTSNYVVTYIPNSGA